MGLDEPELGLGVTKGDEVESPLRGFAQAGNARQNCVANRRRNLSGLPSMTSRTKNGLPPVMRYSTAPSGSCCVAMHRLLRRRTASGRGGAHGAGGQLSENGTKRMPPIELVIPVRRERRAPGPARSSDRGAGGRRASHRHPSARLRGRARSGALELGNQLERDGVRRGRPGHEVSSRPPVVSATSTIGPRGRGVRSESHEPLSTRASPPTSLQKRSRSAVFPIPASPRTSTADLRRLPRRTGWRRGARPAPRRARAVRPRLSLTRPRQSRLIDDGFVSRLPRRPRNRRSEASGSRFPSGASLVEVLSSSPGRSIARTCRPGSASRSTRGASRRSPVEGRSA